MALTGVGRLGVMRLGSTRGRSLARLGFYEAWIQIKIGGTVRRARINGASITDELNHDPNVVTVRVEGTAPVQGQEVQVYCGQVALAEQLFGGHILAVTHAYDAQKPARKCWDVACIDYTWLLGRRKVLKQYAAQSATTILTDLLATFASGISAAGIDAGLPTIDLITFTNEELADAITRVMERVGGYWYVSYAKVLRAFLSEPDVAMPITQAVPRGMKNIRQRVDLSQVATRVTARGGGSTAAIERAIGSVTLPVEDVSWYSASGGTVECGPQRLAYTGVAGFVGLGSTVMGTSPALPTTPTSALNAAVGTLQGTYSYKVTNVFGDGESLPSAASTPLVAETIAPDGAGITLTLTSTGSIPPGTVVRYKVALVTAGGEGPAGRASSTATVGAGGMVSVGAIPTGAAGTTARKVYRSDNGSAFGLIQTIANNTTTSFTDGNSGLGAAPIVVGYKVDVTFAVGPTGTTKRRLYRTTGTGSTYLKVAEIAGNATTTYLDNIADGSLGDEAPVDSTVPTFAGATTIRVADLALFPAGGWVKVGSQLVRYTGWTAPDLLTGIPASGIGSLLTPVDVGTPIISFPHLAGVTGVVYPILKGDQVNLIVTVNDTAAQTAMAAWLGSGDGVHEMFLSDGRWGLVELTARATAELTQRKNPLVVTTYDIRDPTHQSGRSVTVALTSPVIAGTYKIQRVTFTQLGFGPTGGAFPWRAVECSSRRYSFEDLLRSIRGKAAA